MTRAPRPNAPERRKHARVAKSLPVRVHVGADAQRHDGRILNIGGGGVLLKTECPVDTNDQISIDIDLKDENKPISVYGVVVRNDARGMGVSFIRVSEVNADLIAYLIKKWQPEDTPRPDM